MLIQSSCAQEKDRLNLLKGKWILVEEVECPDIIIFEMSGAYTVFNDCGSINPKFPVSEIGNWEYYPEKNEIKFFRREFLSPNSPFCEYHGKNDNLFFKITKLTKNHLKLCFKGVANKACTIESYKRLE